VFLVVKKKMHVGFVLLNCDLGAEEYILDELKQVEQVKNAYVTFGAYDIIAEIHGSDQEEFEKTVSMKIRRLSRIVSTMTLNVVKSG
jgi:DNA-binding Lrp family transcriptional regulator|tara:strand:- start:604 stop:864 length:261 start_codon:yes stop_codon:yes gene_type:complete